MNKISTFLYAWAQVALICFNTYQIANQRVYGALIVGFLISLVWTFNVKRVAFGDASDRLIYSLGAMVGTGSGLLAVNYIY
jgi:hypothetical protein